MLKVDVQGLKPVAFSDARRCRPATGWPPPGRRASRLAVGIVSHGVRALTDFDAFINNNNRGFLGIIPVDEKDKDGKVIGAKIDSLEPKGGAAKRRAAEERRHHRAERAARPPGRRRCGRSWRTLRPGDTVKLKVLRDGEEKDFKAKLTGPLSTSRGDIQNAMGGELSGRRTGFPAVLQTDMVVEPKDCGGPVVDLDGKVLGVNIARAGRVETWILPSENIRPLLTT